MAHQLIAGWWKFQRISPLPGHWREEAEEKLQPGAVLLSYLGACCLVRSLWHRRYAHNARVLEILWGGFIVPGNKNGCIQMYSGNANQVPVLGRNGSGPRWGLNRAFVWQLMSRIIEITYLGIKCKLWAHLKRIPNLPLSFSLSLSEFLLCACNPRIIETKCNLFLQFVAAFKIPFWVCFHFPTRLREGQIWDTKILQRFA